LPLSPDTRSYPQNTLAEIRSTGVRGILIYCSDYHCSHSMAISAEQWPDHVRLSDLETRFVCKACGKKGADVRPDFNWNKRAVAAMGYRWDAIKIVMRGQGKGRLGGGVTTKAPQREPEPRHDP
jgi:hypothetical protein